MRLTKRSRTASGVTNAELSRELVLSTVMRCLAIRAILFAYPTQARFMPLLTTRFTTQSFCFLSGARPTTWERNAALALCSRVRIYLSPCLEIPNSFAFPPVEFWRRTSPRKAANPRPFLKFEATPATVSKIVPVMKPKPGTCISRLQASFSLAIDFNVCSCSAIFLSRKQKGS